MLEPLGLLAFPLPVLRMSRLSGLRLVILLPEAACVASLLTDLLLALAHAAWAIRVDQVLLRSQKIAAWRTHVRVDWEFGRVDELAQTVDARWWRWACDVGVAFEFVRLVPFCLSGVQLRNPLIVYLCQCAIPLDPVLDYFVACAEWVARRWEMSVVPHGHGVEDISFFDGGVFEGVHWLREYGTHLLGVGVVKWC